MSENKRMEQAPDLAATGALLGFAAHLFRSPLSEEQRAFLAGIDFARDDPSLRNAACREGLEAMSAFCAGEDAIAQASTEYHRLFVGPHHLPCPPWGSVYLDRGRLFGPSALEVRKEFARFGFEIPEGTHEPSDHIAYELAFLSEQNERILEAAKAGARDGEATASELAAECRAFLIRYVAGWFAELERLLKAEDKTGFYAGLATLTSGLLKAEDALLSQVAEG